MKKMFSFILTLVVLSTTLLGVCFSASATPSNKILRVDIRLYALSAIGSGYSSPQNRLGPDTYDCSGLAYMAYQHAGIPIPSNCAADQAYALRGNSIPYSARSMGDLIFYHLKSENNGRYKNIDHVAICENSSMIIDAGSKGVTRRPATTFNEKKYCSNNHNIYHIMMY